MGGDKVTYYLSNRQINRSFDYLFCKNVLPSIAVAIVIDLIVAGICLAIGLSSNNKICMYYAYALLAFLVLIIAFAIVLWYRVRKNGHLHFRDRYENGLVEFNLTYNEDKITLFYKNGSTASLVYDDLNKFYNTKEVAILRFEKLYLFVAKHDSTEQFILFLNEKWNEKEM